MSSPSESSDFGQASGSEVFRRVALCLPPDFAPNMADSIPYGRQIIYYSVKAALPLLTALIFLSSVFDLFARFLLWFLPLFGEGLYRAHWTLQRSRYVDPIWRDSAPVPEPSEPFKWSDLTDWFKGCWTAFIQWLKRGVSAVEGWLDALSGGGKKKKTGLGAGSASAREHLEQLAKQRRGE